jgi:uncharacterized protein YlxW (UPF0749 family)
MLEELVADLNRFRMLNGVTVATGPGLEIRLDGPLNALDLQDLLNELRNAGAEALAVNELRLTVSSTFELSQDGELTLDGHAIRRPYVLEAIGDPHTLEVAVSRRGGLVSLLERSHPGLSVEVTQHSHLVLGASRTPVALRYAEVVR